jgi:hypothetical protein
MRVTYHTHLFCDLITLAGQHLAKSTNYEACSRAVSVTPNAEISASSVVGTACLHPDKHNMITFRIFKLRDSVEF